MKHIEYIGPKQDGERHLQDQTGIEWKPGDVKPVQPHHATEFLKHPTSWREVEAPKVPLASAKAPAQAEALPEWAKKGIELGATDEQLQAVAEAGGPETEHGAVLWKDATGADWKAEGGEAQAGAKKAPKAAAKKAK